MKPPNPGKNQEKNDRFGPLEPKESIRREDGN